MAQATPRQPDGIQAQNKEIEAMNILGREIKNGEAVVLKEDVMSEDNKSIKDRVFICVDGFGMLHETAGRAIYGFYESDGIQARIEGHWIDKKETEKLQEIRG